MVWLKRLLLIFIVLAVSAVPDTVARIAAPGGAAGRAAAAPLPSGAAATSTGAEWPMAGANPQRTSWTAEEVKGNLKPEWYTPIDGYIPNKVQVIAANNTLYLATAKGLYALDPATGNQKWIYPTELPLGHSPTVSNGVAYVGGLDRKLHAIDATTGQRRWTFTASAGFETNPLVVNGIVYAGNRDGSLYAVDAATGALRWKFATGGPILYSAAHKGNTIYFASNDGYAYALNATNGALVWKSEKLPGQGFRGFWPVIYTHNGTDYVIFAGSRGYRGEGTWGGGLLDSSPNGVEGNEIYPNRYSDPTDMVGWQKGEESGPWVAGTTTLDLSRPVVTAAGSPKPVPEYFEQKPYRRTVFVLDAATGRELTYDSNGNGVPEYAPFLWHGTYSGTRYPPIVGGDGALYAASNYYSRPYIAAGNLVGWKPGTSIVSVPSAIPFAVDEPVAYSAGGNVVYWKQCCFRQAGAFDLSVANRNLSPTPPEQSREWPYHGYDFTYRLPEFYNGWRFAYGPHGSDQSPPVPYQGRVYLIEHNAIFAYSPTGTLTFPAPPPRSTPISSAPLAGTFPGVTTILSASATTWPSLVVQTNFHMKTRAFEMDPKFYELARVTASDTSSPTSMQQDTSKRSSTQLTFTFDSTKTLKAYTSTRSPATLFDNSNSVYNVNGKFNRIAYVGKSGVVVQPSQATFAGTDMAEPWLLLWNDVDAPRFLPVLVSLQKRPTQIAFSSAGVRLSYGGAAGQLSVIPLNGLSNPALSQAAAWQTSLPADIVARARQLNRISKAHPVDVVETFAEDAATGDVTETFSYSYIDIADDWGTTPLRVAFLPSDLALAAWNGSPITTDGQSLSAHLDLKYPTPLGRVAGVANSSSATVVLPGLLKYWRENTTTPPSFSPTDPALLRLVDEVDKMLAAGHLRPGFRASGVHFDNQNHRLIDYYSNPAETIYSLLRALPLLPVAKQDEVKRYVQAEYTSYPPHTIVHVGWQNGASRESFDYPPDVRAAMDAYGAKDYNVLPAWGGFANWTFPPFNFYALSQYADTFGGASNIFTASKDRRNTMRSTLDQDNYPYLLNSFIAGEIGYLRLATAAGQGTSALLPAKQELARLLIKRIALLKNAASLRDSGFEYGGNAFTVYKFRDSDSVIDFKKVQFGGSYSFGYNGWDNLPDSDMYNWMTMEFMNLVPQHAGVMRDYAWNDVVAAVDRYTTRAPYWFVSFTEGFPLEGVVQPLYDAISIFEAKAMILGASRAELEQYLDVPGFERGDLFYIQKLVSTLYASGSSGSPPATLTPAPLATATASPTATASASPTATASASPTATATPSPTATATATSTPAASPSPTASPTATPLATATSPSTLSGTGVSVSVSSPADGATIPRLRETQLTAIARSDASVTRVELYVDARMVCSGAGESYSCSWRPNGRKGAIYTITAKAYDSAGRSGTSSAVRVTAE